MNKMELWQKWERLKEELGEDVFLNSLFECLSSDEVEENLRWIARHQDIDLFEEEEEEYGYTYKNDCIHSKEYYKYSNK